jgi:type I phosphodiesterase/nucleotide pyrophosphatase
MHINRRQFGACVLGGLAGRLAAANRPKIMVLLVLEQFRPDYIEAGGVPLVAGGFRRLLEKGAWFSDCRHLASTFSATAISTLATGAWPAEHGIVADSWYDRAAKLPVHASDEMLLATTLASQVAADPQARVSVIGMDSVHARLFAGTRDADVYWMGEQGQFVMRGEAPDWLDAFNKQRSPESLHDGKWLTLGARPEAPPLRTLVFDEKHPEQFLALYQSSPFAQDAQFDLLDELVSRDLPAQGNSFHLICLLAGSMARLGYETGAHSPLMQQMTLQLDRRLDSMFTQLSRAVGDTGFGVVLAGAHGAPPAPSQEARPRLAVKGEEIAGAVNRGLTANSLGRVEKYLYPFLYLDTSGFRDPEPIRLVAARAAMEQPSVADFYTAAGACSIRDEWQRRFRNSFHPKRSGDVMLSYRPEYIEDFLQGRGVSYGSLYNYDVRVPLCFFGPQFTAGIYDTPVESVDLASTLARVIGVSPPSSSVGRVLSEALA